MNAIMSYLEESCDKNRLTDALQPHKCSTVSGMQQRQEFTKDLTGHFRWADELHLTLLGGQVEIIHSCLHPALSVQCSQ